MDMKIYTARWNNAQRVAKRLQALLAAGYIVRDEEDCRIKEIELTDYGVYIKDGRCRVILFENDKDWDHGIHTPIKEFNAQFKGWTYYRPQDARPVLGRRKK